ncbi:MAG: modification methylase, partial [Alphaproteobacteria bacterium]|nr:modification methylase [Alphaproteobacteria bacterium]
MAQSTGNTRLQQARRNKKDEFYTQLSDIEKELYHYRE